MRLGGKIKSGMFAAVSYDEGKTWPVRKLITDGQYRFMDGGAWTGFSKRTPTGPNHGDT